MNLGSILKMLGIKVPPDTVTQIEAMLPQIPGKAVEILEAVNDFELRLQRIEALLLKIMEGIDNGSGDTRPAGIGATERLGGSEFPRSGN